MTLKRTRATTGIIIVLVIIKRVTIKNKKERIRTIAITMEIITKMTTKMTNSKTKSITIISIIPAITVTIIPIVITARLKSTILFHWYLLYEYWQ